MEEILLFQKHKKNLEVKAYIYYKHNHIFLLYGHYLCAFDNNQFL